MFTNQEHVKLWSNDEKRWAFVQDFKVWGVWFIQPELGLTFYKYDLPDDSRIIAMEYQREPYYGEKPDGNGETVTASKRYLQCGKYFIPSPTNDYRIADHLKDIKARLMKELKDNAQTHA